jgi:hypothetical protein
MAGKPPELLEVICSIGRVPETFANLAYCGIYGADRWREGFNMGDLILLKTGREHVRTSRGSYRRIREEALRLSQEHPFIKETGYLGLCGELVVIFHYSLDKSS